MPLRVCPSCYKEFFFTESGPIECRHCRARFEFIEGVLTPSTDNRSESERAAAAAQRRQQIAAKVTAAIQSSDWSGLTDDEAREAAADIVLTTSYLVAGREVEREIDIVTAECVYGINLLRDLFVAVRDVFGGRSATTQKMLREARQTALAELRREAMMVGGDAVIAIDLDYQEFSGTATGAGAMLMIVASGTAVRLRALPSEEAAGS